MNPKTYFSIIRLSELDDAKNNSSIIFYHLFCVNDGIHL